MMSLLWSASVRLCSIASVVHEALPKLVPTISQSLCRRNYLTMRSNTSDFILRNLQDRLQHVNISNMCPLKEFLVMYFEAYDPEVLNNIRNELLKLYNTLHVGVAKCKDANSHELRIRLADLQSRLFSGNLHGQNDLNSIMLQVMGGVGGEESAKFATELFDMYKALAFDRGFEFVDIEDGVARVTGGTELFKYEFGVHRVQRVPANSERIHTSSAVVTVVPHRDTAEITFKPSDLLIETMRSRGAGGQSVNKAETAVRITHIPTGTSVRVQNTSSQIANKTRALQLISQKIAEEQKKSLQQLKIETKLSQFKTGDRSERIRTVQFIRDCVVDHRCKIVISGVEPFLRRGHGIELIHDALRDMEEAEIVKFVVENLSHVVKYLEVLRV